MAHRFAPVAFGCAAVSQPDYVVVCIVLQLRSAILLVVRGFVVYGCVCFLLRFIGGCVVQVAALHPGDSGVEAKGSSGFGRCWEAGDLRHCWCGFGANQCLKVTVSVVKRHSGCFIAVRHSAILPS